MKVKLPCILDRTNLVQVSVQTVHSYTQLERAMNEAADRGRTAVIGSDGKLYSFRPEHASIVVREESDAR